MCKLKRANGVQLCCAPMAAYIVDQTDMYSRTVGFAKGIVPVCADKRLAQLQQKVEGRTSCCTADLGNNTASTARQESSYQHCCWCQAASPLMLKHNMLCNGCKLIWQPPQAKLWLICVVTCADHCFCKARHTFKSCAEYTAAAQESNKSSDDAAKHLSLGIGCVYAKTCSLSCSVWQCTRTANAATCS